MWNLLLANFQLVGNSETVPTPPQILEKGFPESTAPPPGIRSWVSLIRGASQSTGSAQGDTAFQTRQLKQRVETSMAARFARAASNPPLRGKPRSSAPAPRLTAERCVPPRLRPVRAAAA